MTESGVLMRQALVVDAVLVPQSQSLSQKCLTCVTLKAVRARAWLCLSEAVPVQVRCHLHPGWSLESTTRTVVAVCQFAACSSGTVTTSLTGGLGKALEVLELPPLACHVLAIGKTNFQASFSIEGASLVVSA